MSNNSPSWCDDQSLSSSKNIQLNSEVSEEKSMHILFPESSSSSLGSNSDNSNSTATVFHFSNEKGGMNKCVADLKPDFQIGGVLSSRNTSKLKDNAPYLFSSKNCNILSSDQELYKSLPGPVPPINLVDCMPSGDLLETQVSPTAISVSSLTSNRKLEWDSGADVGYHKKYDQSVSLCTLERMALGNSTSFLTWTNEYATKKSQILKDAKEVDRPIVYSTNSLFTETDDTYCNSSESKISIPRRKVLMKQKFSKTHKGTSPKRKQHKMLDRTRCSRANPFSGKIMPCEDMKRGIRPSRHFGGCCHSNKDYKKTSNSSHLHSTPLCSSVSSGTSETLKAQESHSAPFKMNYPSFDTSSSSISHISYDKFRELPPKIPTSIDEYSMSVSSSKSKSTSMEITVNETLSAINSSLKDLSDKLRLQAQYLIGGNRDFADEKFERIFEFIDLIGQPATDGSDILFKQSLAEKVIKLLTNISRTQEPTCSQKPGDASSTSVVLEDIGHLSKKFGHKNDDRFFEEVKERCTTPGGTVICVPYRPPASTKTYYITVNEDLLFLQGNELSKPPNSQIPLEAELATGQISENDNECLMMVRRLSGESIFSETNVELLSDQSLHHQNDSSTCELSSGISGPKLSPFGIDHTESTQDHQSLQETVASSFEFYSASSTDANLTTIEECTRMEPHRQDNIADEKKQILKNSEVTQVADKESREKTHHGRKKRYNYEKKVLKCIKALERIEKKLQLSSHPSFSDNASLYTEDQVTRRRKFYSSDSSIETGTTLSNTTTDNEGTFVRHHNPSEMENSWNSPLSELQNIAEYTSSVDRGNPLENLIKASEIKNLKKLLASTKLPGEARAHRFILQESSRKANNFATTVDADVEPNTTEVNALTATTTGGKDSVSLEASSLIEVDELIYSDESSPSDSTKLDVSSSKLSISNNQNMRKDKTSSSGMSNIISVGNENFKDKYSSEISKLLSLDDPIFERMDRTPSSDISNTSIDIKPSVPYSSESKKSLCTDSSARRKVGNLSTDISGSISLDNIQSEVQISSQNNESSISIDKNKILKGLIPTTGSSNVSLINIKPGDQIRPSSEGSKFSESRGKNVGMKETTPLYTDISGTLSGEHNIKSRKGVKKKSQKIIPKNICERLPLSEIITTYTDSQYSSKQVDPSSDSNIYLGNSHSSKSGSNEQPIKVISTSDEISNIEENLQRLRLRYKSLKDVTEQHVIAENNTKLTNVRAAKDRMKGKQVRSDVKSRDAVLADTGSKKDYTKFKMTQDLIQLNKENGMSLKEALYVAKPSYVIDAESRRAKILRKAKLRQEVQSHNHSVLARLPESLKTPSTLQGFLVKNEDSPLFQYKAMIAQNRRLVRLLPETSQKEAVNKKNATLTTNRLMGRLYSRKLKKKVLGGKVSHGHKLIVSPIS